ncbi:MAG: AAA family ATPase, partial [Deltaproteobacteria bacterium]|nr:AAA family ATPase [Deltaproteobacteria bacterium]
MRLVRAKLKGFKGIKRGMGLDILDIDFTKLPTGLIAFVGSNGRGKTTTLDNMHPFRVFPSRSGSSFYDLCEGVDAQKELVFEYGGGVYRSVIHVDADRKKQEAYLYRQDGSDWISINKDGKTTSYDAAVESIMGSEKLFFLSVFRAQNAKPLSAHTKGELKEIFEDLLGLDEIREKGEKAKEVKKHLLSVRDRLKGEIDGLAGVIKEREAQEKRFGKISGEMSSLAEECKIKEKVAAETDSRIAGITASIAKNEAAQAAIARLKKEAARNDTKKQALLTSLKTREAEYGKKVDEKAKKLERIRKIADNGHVIREKVEEEKNLSTALDELKRSLTSLDEKERALS